MEATGRYGEALAKWLFEKGHRVSAVTPVVHTQLAVLRGLALKLSFLSGRVCRQER